MCINTLYIYILYIERGRSFFFLFFFLSDGNGAKTPSFYNDEKEANWERKSHIMKIEDGENSNINIIINNNYNKYNICTIINGAVVDAVGLNLRYPVNLSLTYL